MKEIHYSAEMNKCPYCGDDEFFIKQRYSGTCEYRYRYDKKPAENGEMYENARFKSIGKYAYCMNCGKRLFPISELDETEFEEEEYDIG